MNNSSMVSTHSSSDQGAQVIAFAPPREQVPVPRVFSDNLDHLQALEFEAKLMLSVASMRSCMLSNTQPESQWNECRQYFPFLPPDAGLEQVQALLHKTSQDNRCREEDSARHGMQLLFPLFCSSHRLEPFERSIVLLLFMKSTAPQFIDIYRKCKFEGGNYEGLEIGSLLAIICDSLRDQLANRSFFSVDATLMKEKILLFCSHLDDSTNILDVSVCLHERAIRFILGDKNLYNSLFSGIKRERSDVQFGQIVLPGSLKNDIETRVGNYLQSREDGSMDKFDDFFGYGTALTLLFHGPSGTGKTMLAQGIANRFDREIISLNISEVSEQRGSLEDLLEAVFHEASMHGAIVFLDECDDLFEDNSRISRALLIEVEKARCVVILATNKPVNLDPAMDRRIAMKVQFTLPDAELRLQMWEALIPDTVTVAPDIDLAHFAERFRFSGGLIKNSIFMALASSCRNNHTQLLLTSEELEKAANLQTASLNDLNRICTVQKPTKRIEELPLGLKQRNELNNLAKAWGWLNVQGLCFNLLFNCIDIETGVHAVEGLAAACGMTLRIFNFAQVSSYAEDAKVIDPVTQRRVSPMIAAFSAAASEQSLTLFIDFEGEIGSIFDSQYEKIANSMYPEMLSQLRRNKGLFCLVTKGLKTTACPIEFNQLVTLTYPAEELQRICWMESLDAETLGGELESLVSDYPMHASEIKFVARQAMIKSIIKSGSAAPDIHCVREIAATFRKKSSTRVLFGGDHD